MTNKQPPEITARAFEFAVRIVKLCQHLDESPGVARTLARRLIRSGTSIGANLEEGKGAQSEADYLTKCSIACKEARETLYWLKLLAVSEIPPSNRLSELTTELRTQAKLAVKDEYTFDFLELGEEHSERELERALIARIEDFLRAMGGMFAFMGSQYRLEVDGKEFFIDLLLFHRRLRCLVAIELKVGEFLPEFVGKMQFYLAALDRQIRQEDENPSIGIILCKEKGRTIVEYALHDARKPIGVATYEITKTLPKALKGQLPSPKDIAHLLEDL